MVECINGSDGKVSVQFENTLPSSTGLKAASENKNYKAFSGTLSWSNGDNSPKTIKITLLPDQLSEGTHASDLTIPGTGSVLSINDLTLASAHLTLGGQRSKAINTRHAVWVPQIRFELEHQLIDDYDSMTASFIHDPSASEFTVQNDQIDTDYINLSVGSSVVFRNGKMGYIEYETRLAQDRPEQYWLKQV